MAYAPKSFSDNLGDLGFTGSFDLLLGLTSADSKTLDHAKRVHLLEVLNSRPDELKWAVRVMSPHDISRHMLQRVPNNLYVNERRVQLTYAATLRLTTRRAC